MHEVNSFHTTANINPTHPLESKNVGSIVKVTEQNTQIKSLASAKLSFSEAAKPLDNNITSAESEFSDPQVATSDKVGEACDLFFQKEKILHRATVEAAVERVFNAIMDAENQSMENVETEQQEDIQEDDRHEVVQAEQATPTEGSGEVSEEVAVSPEELKENIRNNLKSLSDDNRDHRFVFNDHAFHFSLISENTNEHQIEIIQKIGHLGQGAFGKVSLFKNMQTGKVYAAKQANPREGLPLYQAKENYLQSQELVKIAQEKFDKATNDDEKISAETELNEAKTYLEWDKSVLDKTEFAEKDIKKEIKNLKFYNPDPDNHVTGVQPRFYKYSTNLGTEYLITRGTDGDDLLEKLADLPEENRDGINKKMIESLTAGLNYMTLEKEMCHSDIKPGNILCEGGGEFLTDDDFQIYHSDFGADRPISKIVSKLCDPADKTEINELMISTAPYTSSKIIDDIDTLRKSIHVKLGEGKNIDNEKEKMKKLIIQSCQFSLGLTLFEMCTDYRPKVAAFAFGLSEEDQIPGLEVGEKLPPGLLFGNKFSKDENNEILFSDSYESDLQVVSDGLQYVNGEAREQILTLLGKGESFDVKNFKVILR